MSLFRSEDPAPKTSLQKDIDDELSAESPSGVRLLLVWLWATTIDNGRACYLDHLGSKPDETQSTVAAAIRRALNALSLRQKFQDIEQLWGPRDSWNIPLDEQTCSENTATELLAFARLCPESEIATHTLREVLKDRTGRQAHSRLGGFTSIVPQDVKRAITQLGLDQEKYITPSKRQRERLQYDDGDGDGDTTISMPNGSDAELDQAVSHRPLKKPRLAPNRPATVEDADIGDVIVVQPETPSQHTGITNPRFDTESPTTRAPTLPERPQTTIRRPNTAFIAPTFVAPTPIMEPSSALKSSATPWRSAREKNLLAAFRANQLSELQKHIGKLTSWRDDVASRIAFTDASIGTKAVELQNHVEKEAETKAQLLQLKASADQYRKLVWKVPDNVDVTLLAPEDAARLRETIQHHGGYASKLAALNSKADEVSARQNELLEKIRTLRNEIRDLEESGRDDNQIHHEIMKDIEDYLATVERWTTEFDADTSKPSSENSRLLTQAILKAYEQYAPDVLRSPTNVRWLLSTPFNLS